MSYVLGAWKLASDLKVTAEFEFQGVYSHWQVWIAVGAGLQILSFMLNRYGTGGELRLPRIFFLKVAEPPSAVAQVVGTKPALPAARSVSPKASARAAGR